MSKPIRYWMCDKKVDSILKKVDNQETSFYYETFDGGRITKGYLLNTHYDVVRVVARMVNNSSLIKICNDGHKVTENGLLLPVMYQAQAICDPKDTIDEEVGKKIVQQKLLDAYHADFDKGIVNALTHLTHSIARIKKYCDEQEIDISGVCTATWLINHPDYLLSNKSKNFWI